MSRYSGVSIGWGWSREKETYAANNTVSFNAIHDYKLQLPHASLGGRVIRRVRVILRVRVMLRVMLSVIRVIVRVITKA